LSVSLAGYVSTNRGSVRVASDSTSTQNFFLNTPTPPGSISGKVSKAADDAALAGARVILSRTGGGGGGGFTPDTVVTDAEGAFAFDSVPNQNNYTLTVSAEGFATTVNNNVDVAGGSKTEVDFALTSSVSGDTTATVKGVVTDAATDEPVANATVILTRLAQGGGGGQGTALDTITTNEDGEYSFDSLAAGSYRINASAAGKSGASNSLALIAGSVFVADIGLSPSSGILVKGRGAAGVFRTHWVSGRMVVDLGRFAGSARSVEVYSLAGTLKHRIPVAPGAASVTLPAAVTPATGSLVRIGF
jgi:Carboxypeptidase regulatory-like domain